MALSKLDFVGLTGGIHDVFSSGAAPRDLIFSAKRFYNIFIFSVQMEVEYYITVGL